MGKGTFLTLKTHFEIWKLCVLHTTIDKKKTSFLQKCLLSQCFSQNIKQFMKIPVLR